MQDLEMIAALSDAFGPSGFEDDAVAVARSYVPEGFEAKEDCLRNLYISRDGGEGKPVVMIDAHSDELGFMVQAIRPDGTLAFLPLGAWVASTMPAHRVNVRTRDGRLIPGIIGSKPPHFLSEAEKNKAPDVGSLWIDIGASGPEEAKHSFGVGIGAPAAPDVRFEYDKEHDLMLGKAFDNRLGCAAVLSTLSRLKDEKLKVEPVGTLTVQEEVGERGASLAVHQVKPSIAIIFEGAPADDRGTESWLVQTAVHHGPMLRHIDSSMITSPRFQRWALDLAEELGIPVQESVRSGGSTNGAPVHLAEQGVPCIVIGVPVRYAHSHHGIASYRDFEDGVRLAVEIIRRLDEETLAKF
ncbi:MAG: M20/M25/M40 family metallo-hydrolase [Clostridia bacterium]|nr:M20/M25/M40 family metallo-hydrolase [Clostridia bacterium]